MVQSMLTAMEHGTVKQRNIKHQSHSFCARMDTYQYALRVDVSFLHLCCRLQLRTSWIQFYKEYLMQT
jgi:hypothetical protein